MDLEGEKLHTNLEKTCLWCCLKAASLDSPPTPDELPQVQATTNLLLTSAVSLRMGAAANPSMPQASPLRVTAIVSQDRTATDTCSNVRGVQAQGKRCVGVRLGCVQLGDQASKAWPAHSHSYTALEWPRYVRKTHRNTPKHSQMRSLRRNSLGSAKSACNQDQLCYTMSWEECGLRTQIPQMARNGGAKRPIRYLITLETWEFEKVAFSKGV